MAYDPATGTMLLFGGQSDRWPVYLGDTWSWNGTTWTRLSPPTSPSARLDASIAYDAATRTVLLFGGEGKLHEGAYGSLSDTWSWNGTTWTKLSSPGNPGAADNDSMAYDPATATVLLLLGYPNGFDQTWSWNGTTWTRLSPPTSPPVSRGWSMAYDPATATVLLFGGGSNRISTGPLLPRAVLGETWSWNGTTWTKLSPAGSPSARDGASMAYDPGMQAMLLFGDGYDQESNGTWTLRDP
ncbi:MAG: hypothetical protein ACRDN1_26250 [Trebonia sp.]